MVIMSFLQSNVSKPLRSWNLKLETYTAPSVWHKSQLKWPSSLLSPKCKSPTGPKKQKSCAALWESAAAWLSPTCGIRQSELRTQSALKDNVDWRQGRFPTSVQRRSNAKRLHFKTFKTFKVSSLPVSAGTLVHVSFITASLDRYFCVNLHAAGRSLDHQLISIRTTSADSRSQSLARLAWHSGWICTKTSGVGDLQCHGVKSRLA